MSRGLLAARCSRLTAEPVLLQLNKLTDPIPTKSKHLFETENDYRKLIFDGLQLVMAILLKGHRQKALALNTFGSVLQFNKASIEQNTSLASFEIVFSLTRVLIQSFIS